MPDNPAQLQEGSVPTQSERFQCPQCYRIYDGQEPCCSEEAIVLPPERPTQSTTTVEARQCPGCGAITDRFEHCHRRPSPMFPQLDEYETTVPVLVEVVDHLCHPRLWTDPERRERQCSRGTKGCEVEHG